MKKILIALVSILGLAACEVEPINEVEQTLKLSVDNSEIFADGEQVATFIVKDLQENIVEGATILFTETNEALDGNTFKTKFAGQYKFYAKKDNAISNDVTVVAKVKENNDNPDNPENPENPGGQDPTPDQDTLQLSADKQTIVADGADVVTFSTTLNGEAVEATIYNAFNNTALQGKTFSTSESGTYSFYAKYNDIVSETVTIVAEAAAVEEEKPITIEASAYSLKANGVDVVTILVIQDGANVTSKSTIFVNGGAMNGNKFSTTTAGTYTLYATKGSVKSNEISIEAEAVESGTEIVFADGVTISSGWYDVNKKGQGDNGDINMCWAAASSNMIQWFQDRYVAAGHSLPSTAVTGPGTKTYAKFGPYELALMEIYHSEWNNSKGGHTEEAIPWYFEGKLYKGEVASAGSQAVPNSAGGYWNSIWSNVVKNVYHDYNYVVVPGVVEYPNMYTYLYNNYMLWGDGSSLEGKQRLAYFTNLVVEAFERGMASMTISLSANIASLHHAVTLWGYEIDKATGLLTRVWITDSDDLVSEPKSQILNEYSVSIGEGKSHIKLSGNTRYGNAWIVSLHPFSGYQE